MWKSTSELGFNVASMAWGARNLISTQVAWLREADAEFQKAVAASPGLRDLANLGFLQLDLVRAYCALGDASSVDDAERRLAAVRASA